jgi:hypothetical protein
MSYTRSLFISWQLDIYMTRGRYPPTNSEKNQTRVNIVCLILLVRHLVRLQLINIA